MKYEENIFVVDKDSGIYHYRINDDYYFRRKFALNITGVQAISYFRSDFAILLGISNLLWLLVFITSS